MSMKARMTTEPRSYLVSQVLLSFSVLVLCSTSHAQSITKQEAALIDEGFRIFMEETFEGNGRTCGTCHVPSKQYSIDPQSIRRMNREERNLLLASTVPGLENPTLLEELALFNTGGGDATIEWPEGPFRAAQQITALNATTLAFAPFDPATGLPVHQRLGWSGDGSPTDFFHHGNMDLNADGTVRAFANGAIAQHATKSLARVAKSTACNLDINESDAECDRPYDFRFATDAELNALDAFQRWLGRRPAPGTPDCSADNTANPLNLRCKPPYLQALPPGGKGEFTLVAFDENVLQTGPSQHEMIFSDPVVKQGKQIFQSDQASCFLCHQNGGAHFGNNSRPHGNLDRNQGIQEFRFGLIEQTGVNIPHDPGNGAIDGAQPRAMNVQTIIEAARRTHFAHNNAIMGFETMVGEGFHKPFVRDLDPELGCNGIGIPGTGSPGREGLVGASNDSHADSEECLEEAHGPYAVNSMAAFLRTLSAWYSLRDVERLVAETCDRIDLGVSIMLPAMEAGFALDDVNFVLRGAKVAPRPHIQTASKARKLRNSLHNATRKQDKRALKQVHQKARKLRHQIATTTQEGASVDACL